MAIRKFIAILFSFILGIGSCWADDIEVPVDEDPNEINGNRHRTRPMQHMCVIDIEGATISSSIPDIVGYELLDASGATVASGSASIFIIDCLTTLPEGTYTIRIVTPDKSYSGSFYLPTQL